MYQFYFLSNQYFIDFNDVYLMQNKSTIQDRNGRPCFLAFDDNNYPDIKWLVPISSKYSKYKAIEQSKIAKYGSCITLSFGIVANQQKAFLIQNMCPSTMNYLTPYIDKLGNPISVNNIVANDVVQKAKQVLALEQIGKHILFTDSMRIYNKLVSNLI